MARPSVTHLVACPTRWQRGAAREGSRSFRPDDGIGADTLIMPMDARYWLRMDHCSDSPGDMPASARAYLAGVPRASAAQQTTNHHRWRGSSGQEPGKRYREGRPGRV